jgi:hypothetical protein
MRQLPAATMLLAAVLAAAWLPADEPRFSRHVVPLLSRLGCNAGTCHGKVKGENGFRLSLFGVDPAADHASLLKEFGGRRVNRANVGASLILLKPLGEVAHGGGRLITAGSPEHEIMHGWLAAGAKLDPLNESRIESLTVSPANHTLTIGEKFQLQAETRFSDGTTEDVTSLCRFEAVNRDVVSISAGGEVTATAVGDTAIVVRYGAEPVVAMVLVPGTKIDFPQFAGNSFIDDHVVTTLRTLNIAPAPLCDDATFLRRASLDITGGPGFYRGYRLKQALEEDR